MNIKANLLLAIALLGLAAPAWAVLPDEIQVYDDSFNPRGRIGVELHLNHTIDGATLPTYAGEVTTGGATRLTPEFSLGLGGGFEAGLYINTVVDRHGTAFLAGAKLRMKYIIHPAPDGGLFYGVNVEVGRIGHRFEAGRTGLELRPILGWRSKDWLLVVNPNLEFALEGIDSNGVPDFAPGVKIGRKIARGVMIGTEMYRDFGSFAGFAPIHEEATEVYAVVDVDRGPFVFNLGIGRGFSGADRWTVKTIISLPF
ncbi:MAG: hypothetical protein RL490_598 [Pseudomonadota bacterium]|jgi:hypothetical protein